jgi:hypothetical protein
MSDAPDDVIEAMARAMCVSYDMDPDELERASDRTDEMVPRWMTEVPHVLALLRAASAAGWRMARKLDLYEVLNRAYGHEIATEMVAQLAAAPKLEEQG